MSKSLYIQNKCDNIYMEKLECRNLETKKEETFAWFKQFFSTFFF